MSRYTTDGYRSSQRIGNLAGLKHECKSQYVMSLVEPNDYKEYINPNNLQDEGYFMKKCMADPQNMKRVLGGRKSRRTKRRGTKRTKTRRRRR
jgi:hypothetical protein